ncbi:MULTISPECIES: dihydrodipicolinate synthase family protein [Rhodococcus]|uniref:Putative dehydratase n=1 Tax=Rhodococcus wratislaviensis NBRC 100605 TaxID=1219028 RepID=X0PVC9_RHOWR|nr:MULTISPECIES: dihydrodipicolinate synthase family protein [Rhodococcus]WAM19094.1 dihydrodipicolinate synthase family protein [Rhodococcus sp. JS3073]GAF47163.1 putative dehydratase [Rhodococcus wratislaviensis NBRC 100605]
MTISRTENGVYSIAPTPFTPDGSVDYTSIDRMVDFYTQAGVTGLTVLGVLGEAPKLTQEESVEIASRIITRADFPVIVGVSAPGFAAMKSLSGAVMDAGAAGVMIAPLRTLRTDDQITNYYRNASQAVGTDTPFVIQDFPLTFSVEMSVSVIARIANENANAVMLKHEDWPGLEKISALRALEEDGAMPRLSILCGNGGSFLDFETERGADGAMTGYCFPDTLVELVGLAGKGERDAAHDLFDAHLPLLRYEQQPGVGLAVRKYVFQRRGVLDYDAQRAPAGKLTDTARQEVDYLLDRLARRDSRAANLPK